MLGKIDLDAINPAKKAKEEPEPEVPHTEQVEEQPLKEEKTEPTPEPEIVPEPKKVPEHIETVVTNLEQPKVIDKIDLSALNPKKKKNTEKKQEVPAQPAQAPKPAAVEPQEEEQPAIPERKVEFIKTEVAKLTGPKVMGKIELPVEKPKESKKEDRKAAENADKKKKK